MKERDSWAIIRTEVDFGGDWILANLDWDKLSYNAKNRQLFLEQKRTLELFLERGAISQEQYDKSLHDLMEKMNVRIYSEPENT